MEISPVTRKEHFLARAAGDEDALELQPVTREEHFLQNIIDAIEEGGGGGSITVDTSLNGSSTNPVENQAIFNAFASVAYQLGNKVSKPTIVESAMSSLTITPEDNTIYECGELTSLTISNPPATGEYEIDFISGATPTVCAFDDIRWPDNTAPTIAANTEYEISVKNNKGLCVGWPVPEVTP